MSITVRSAYITLALNPAAIRGIAEDALEGVGFDTFVGTGMSGVLPLALLAEHFNVSYAAVRKPDDSSHADGLIEGTIGKRWVFVDDFISTGNTFNRAYETVWKAAKYRDHATECVGVFQYERDEDRRWLNFGEVCKRYPRVSRVHRELTAPPKPVEPKPPVPTIRFDGLNVTVGPNPLEGPSPWTFTIGPSTPEPLMSLEQVLCSEGEPWTFMGAISDDITLTTGENDGT